VRTLVAVDLDLGPDFERALRELVASETPFCVLDRRVSPERRRAELAWLGAGALLDAEGRHDLEAGSAVDDEIGLVMLTSGSSGPPKAAELTWAALRASARITQSTLRRGGDPVWLPCLPPCHIGGLAVVLRAVLDDARLYWGDPDDLAAGPALGATHVAVVRTQLARQDLSGFEVVLLGGGRPPAPRPANVVATWGMTETGSGIVYDGRPLPEVEVVSAGGELLVRSPTLLRSYRDAPRPRRLGPDGRDDWFPTGDGGEVVDGVVRVRGRLGFVITSGGEKIWPEDLEAALATVPGVREAAVTAEADPEWGERVVALVVEDSPVADGALAQAAHEAIGPWAKPKVVRRVASLPRTANGKLRRGDLPGWATR
jgi:O-succinylbenzoic acid--CoA ligase